VDNHYLLKKLHRLSSQKPKNVQFFISDKKLNKIPQKMIQGMNSGYRKKPRRRIIYKTFTLPPISAN